MTTIDLSADVGESFGSHRIGDDERLLGALSSANVACGFHSGDPVTMERTVRLCLEQGVAIGAHPGFPDLVGFGRRTIEMSRAEVRADVLYQPGARHASVPAAGGRLPHVSPHGGSGTSPPPTRCTPRACSTRSRPSTPRWWSSDSPD